MGFGHIGRYIYLLAQNNSNFNITCISDIGKPEILSYLLNNEPRIDKKYDLDGNYIISNESKARIIHGVEHGDVPWDVFDVDWVVDSTVRLNGRLRRHRAALVNVCPVVVLPEEHDGQQPVCTRGYHGPVEPGAHRQHQRDREEDQREDVHPAGEHAHRQALRDGKRGFDTHLPDGQCTDR